MRNSVEKNTKMLTRTRSLKKLMGIVLLSLLTAMLPLVNLSASSDHITVRFLDQWDNVIEESSDYQLGDTVNLMTNPVIKNKQCKCDFNYWALLGAEDVDIESIPADYLTLSTASNIIPFAELDDLFNAALDSGQISYVAICDTSPIIYSYEWYMDDGVTLYAGPNTGYYGIGNNAPLLAPAKTGYSFEAWSELISEEDAYNSWLDAGADISTNVVVKYKANFSELTPSPTPTPTPTQEPTPTPTPTQAPTPTPTPTSMLTPTQVPSQVPDPTSVPTPLPTQELTQNPVQEPTQVPTPNIEPSDTPKPTEVQVSDANADDTDKTFAYNNPEPLDYASSDTTPDVTPLLIPDAACIVRGDGQDPLPTIPRLEVKGLEDDAICPKLDIVVARPDIPENIDEQENPTSDNDDYRYGICIIIIVLIILFVLPLTIICILLNNRRFHGIIEVPDEMKVKYKNIKKGQIYRSWKDILSVCHSIEDIKANIISSEGYTIFPMGTKMCVKYRGVDDNAPLVWQPVSEKILFKILEERSNVQSRTLIEIEIKNKVSVTLECEIIVSDLERY